MGVSRCTVKVWRGDGVYFEWGLAVVSFGCLVVGGDLLCASGIEKG